MQAYKEQHEQASSAELLSLRESIDNLKGLLASAEKKYTHLSAINTDLQKKIDVLEQQHHIRNDQMWVYNCEMRSSSVNMRGARGRVLMDSDDERDEELPLLGNVTS